MNQESRRSLVGWLWCCALSGLLVPASAQTTVYSTLGENRSYTFFTAIFEAGWSQTGTFSNVSIAAKLDGGGGTVSGTAYLMTRVGPGTTIADELARYDYSVTSPPFQPELKTLFSGLTLGPGSYYLVLSGSRAFGGWELADTFFPEMAPGVEVVHRRRSGSAAPYAPASFFPQESASDFRDSYFQYIVSVIPEPNAMALCFLGAAAAFVGRPRLRR